MDLIDFWYVYWASSFYKSEHQLRVLGLKNLDVPDQNSWNLCSKALRKKLPQSADFERLYISGKFQFKVQQCSESKTFVVILND